MAGHNSIMFVYFLRCARESGNIIRPIFEKTGEMLHSKWKRNLYFWIRKLETSSTITFFFNKKDLAMLSWLASNSWRSCFTEDQTWATTPAFHVEKGSQARPGRDTGLQSQDMGHSGGERKTTDWLGVCNKFQASSGHL